MAQAEPEAPTYCLALRGNGESEPAHWGALAAVVERLGLPAAQAGGSSATISLFLLESIARNPAVARAESHAVQKSRASLLLKSLHGFAGYLASTPQVQAGLGVLQVYRQAEQVTQSGLLERIRRFGAGDGNIRGQEQALRQLGRDLISSGLGTAPRYVEMMELAVRAAQGGTLSSAEVARLSFYAGEAQRAIATMGAFNAESDADLFFRDGLIDFGRLADKIGEAAGFYISPADPTAFERFLSTCEPDHEGKSWDELASSRPDCQAALFRALTAHFSAPHSPQQNPVHEQIGFSIPTFGTTATLVGRAAEEARRSYEAYHNQLNRDAAASFRVSNPDEIRFGYWAPTEWLQRAQDGIRTRALSGSYRAEIRLTNDETSSRFLALGSATWRDVLSLSPAEPGLAAIQPMSVNGRPAYSAGGWSDLHPVALLKAAGCENVIYVTRRGGNSFFGQGVAKRLFGFDRPWERLRTDDPALIDENRRINDAGDPLDQSSLWSRLFNLANPSSSFVTSLRLADGVLCTDWDRFDVKTQMRELIADSYRAPFLAAAGSAIDRALRAGQVVTQDLRAVARSGDPRWSGCSRSIDP